MGAKATDVPSCQSCCVRLGELMKSLYVCTMLVWLVCANGFVSLTGKVVLTRSPETGLFVAYREFWDQSVVDVLKTAKL